MHEHRIPGIRPKFSLLVASSTRSKDTDTAGRPVMELLRKEGYEVAGYRVVNDDMEAISEAVIELISMSEALVISGGTGISGRDLTVDAVKKMSEKEIRGFATVFTMLSYGEIGTSAIMSSASAYVVKNKPVFCLPGSPAGLRMGVEKIILPEIDHIMHELAK